MLVTTYGLSIKREVKMAGYIGQVLFFLTEKANGQ